MPINQLPEYYAQQARYESAVSVTDKIRELEKLIASMRKHKGTEKLMLQLHTKLAKLREESQKQKRAKKSSGKSNSLPKEGFQIVILGFTNSGKSTLLNKLTNADTQISEFPYTTRKPVLGMMDYGGAKVQLVEVPAITSKENAEILAYARNADGVIIIFKDEKERDAIEKALDENSIHVPAMKVNWNENVDAKKIFNFFKLIRVYTKQPGEKPEMNKPIVLKEGETVTDAAKEVHKDFAKKLKYACVWGSARFQGQRVEKTYKLKDGDVVEYHI